MMQKFVLIYRRSQNRCLLELWLPHAACKWDTEKGTGLGRGNLVFQRQNWGVIYSALQLCSESTLFLVVLLKQELTPLGIRPVDDVLNHIQEGRHQAESLQCWLHVSMLLTAPGFVSGGAKFGKIEVLLSK